MGPIQDILDREKEQALKTESRRSSAQSTRQATPVGTPRGSCVAALPRSAASGAAPGKAPSRPSSARSTASGAARHLSSSDGAPQSLLRETFSSQQRRSLVSVERAAVPPADRERAAAELEDGASSSAGNLVAEDTDSVDRRCLAEEKRQTLEAFMKRSSKFVSDRENLRAALRKEQEEKTMIDCSFEPRMSSSAAGAAQAGSGSRSSSARGMYDRCAARAQEKQQKVDRLRQDMDMRKMLQCSFRPMTSSNSRSSTPRRYTVVPRPEQARPAAPRASAAENGYAAAAARRASFVQAPAPGVPVTLAERFASPRRGSAGAAGFQPPGRGAPARSSTPTAQAADAASARTSASTAQVGAAVESMEDFLLHLYGEESGEPAGPTVR